MGKILSIGFSCGMRFCCMIATRYGSIEMKGGDIVKIGYRIKERRTQLKMSADDLARRIGKDRSTVYRYESGGIDKVSVDMLEPLAKALQTTPAYLIGHDSDAIGCASAHVVKDGVYASYTSTNEVQVRNMEKWVQEMGHIEFTENELAEIISFSKYLLFRRSME